MSLQHSAQHSAFAETREWLLSLAPAFAPAKLIALCLPLRRNILLRDVMLLNASYPAEWVAWYIAMRADRFDPVLQWALHSGMSFTWNRKTISISHKIDAVRSEPFMNMATLYGIEAGAIGVCLSPDRWMSCMALAGPSSCAYEQLLPHLILHTHQAHERFRALIQRQQLVWPFSDQEVRTLRALQLGWSAPTIANTLGTTSRCIYRLLAKMSARTGLSRERALQFLDRYQRLSLAGQ